MRIVRVFPPIREGKESVGSDVPEINHRARDLGWQAWWGEDKNFVRHIAIELNVKTAGIRTVC